MTADPTTRLDTEHAPAERAPEDQILRDHRLILDSELLVTLMDAVPGLLAVLDPHRQIVAANQHLIDSFEVRDLPSLLGLRPGEAIRCAHAGEGPGGCGTSRACRSCGAVSAVMISQNTGRAVTRDCEIQRSDGTSHDLRVTAAPLHLGDRQFTVCTLEDISHENRRRALERTFFHDVLNLVGGIHGLSLVLREKYDDRDKVREISAMMEDLVDQLVDEIEAQRDIARAERQLLEVETEDFGSRRLLEEVAALYRGHEAGRGRSIVIDSRSEDLPLHTGRVLLFRVLGNMVKNALEAEPPGSVVTLHGAGDGPGHVRFQVRNPAVVPDRVQLQLFKRSFSTKGTGRGLGTYGMKLLGEQYLGGEVSFTSEEGQGTVFTIRLPRVLPSAPFPAES